MAEVVRKMDLAYRVWLGGPNEWYSGPLEAVVHPLKQLALDAGVDTAAAYVCFQAEYSTTAGRYRIHNEIHGCTITGVKFSHGGTEHLIDDGLMPTIEAHLLDNIYDYAQRAVSED